MNKLNINETAKFLLEHDNFHIIAHASPDGDTIGSSFALHYALKSINKKSKVVCKDEISRNQYYYILDSYEDIEVEPETVITMDIADIVLLGGIDKNYSKIHLAIDHHFTHKDYADNIYLKSDGSSTCENVLFLLLEMGITITPLIANCLYTGIVTDTGCFKYKCSTALTHKAAGILVDSGACFDEISFVHFDRISKNYIKFESLIQSKAEYYFNDKCVVFTVLLSDIESCGVTANDIDKVVSKSKQIDGVEIALVLKEKSLNEFKISVRTSENYSAVDICSTFGGGGHIMASGCKIDGNLEDVKQKLLEVVSKQFNG